MYVSPDQRPLAIGKQGQNVRLASQLTGYEIDILDVKDLPEDIVAAAMAGGGAPVAQPKEREHVALIEKLEGLTPEIVAKLAGANLTNVEQLKGLSAKDFSTIEGISEAEGVLIAEALKRVK